MPSPRQEVATVILDGKIYVAGGMDQGCCNALDDFTVYDIASDSWTTLANLPLALNHVGLAAMNGKVYLIGGLYSEVGPGPLSISAQVWEYDIAASHWSRKADLLHPTWAPAVVTYAAKIYVFAGSATLSWADQSNQVEETQRYDPATNAWTDNLAPMPVARNHIQAVVVGDKAYVSPGRHVSSVFGDATFSRYDFLSDTWTELAPLPGFSRSGGGLARVGNQLYFIGGEGSGPAGLEKVHAYDIQSNTWVEVDSLLTGVHGVWAVSLGNEIFVPGGGSIEGVLPQAKNQAYELTTVDVGFNPALDVAGGTVSGVTQTAIGDLNGDGLPDIGVFEGGKHASGRKTFAWFEAPAWTRHEFNPSLQPGPFVGAAAFADINRDGRLDLVVSSDLHSGGTVTGSMYWFQNPGGAATGAWPRHTIAQDLSDTEHINDIGIADMDRDGLLDVVIRHLGATLKVRILFQNTPDSWTVRTLPVRAREGLKLADLDRDGRLDIVLNGFWWAAPVNPRTEAFTEYVIDSAYYSLPATGLNNSVKIGVGDLDGDGTKDVLFSVAEGGAVYLAWFKCPSNPRTQAWTRTIIEGNFTGGHQAELGDMDNDGDLDLVDGFSFGALGVFIYRNSGNGTAWTKQALTTSLGIYSGVVGDIGADGDLDIVGADTYSFASKPWLYENLGAPVLAKATVRNGTGVNPSCFSANLPILGSAWTAVIDTRGHPGANMTAVFGHARPATGPVIAYGELLVDPASNRLWRSLVPPNSSNGLAQHGMNIPTVSSLVGFTATVQGMILGRGVELCNAIDLVMGF